jgi:hypothetical protein
MEPIYSSETWGFLRTACRYKPEYRSLINNCCKNHKSNTT